MPSQYIPKGLPDPALLTIYFDTKEPLSASLLGEIFVSLAAEYRKIDKGGQLVLFDVAEGSLRLRFATAAGIAAAAAGLYAGADRMADGFNHFYDFSKNVTEIVKGAHEGSQNPEGERTGSKSARAVLEAAVAAKSGLRLEYTNSGGERLLLELIPPEVRHARDKINATMAGRKRPPQAAKARAHAPISDVGARIEAYASTRETIPAVARAQADGTFAVVIGLFVQALRENGSDLAVDRVAHDLEARGLQEVARLVRRQLGGRGVHRLGVE